MSAPEAPEMSTDTSFGTDNLVTLLVGPEEQSFAVHESFITQSSDFFKAALKKEWIEGQTRTIKLPEECPQTTTDYLRFVYSQKLPTSSVVSLPKHGMKDDLWMSLANLYVFGERRLDTTLKNAVVKEIMRIIYIKDADKYTWFMVDRAMNQLYEGTTASSPVRRLLVDRYVAVCDPTWFGGTDRLHPDFLLDFAKAVAKKLNDKESFEKYRDVNLVVDNYLE